MFAVKINNLNHSINSHNILKDINLELEKDKIACILGPSGCGKTTLLKLIAGLEKIKYGEILLNDIIVSSSSRHLETEKRKIGFLFQDYALFPHLTVKENLNFAIKDKNKITHEIDEIIEIIREDKDPKLTIMNRWKLSDMQTESILNLRLGSSKTHINAIMVDLVGEKGYSGPVHYEGIDSAFKYGNVSKLYKF